mgnify:CR=1 FL=1
MIKKICSWLLFKLFGWKLNVTVGFPEKFIIALAPHTSNWDFVLGVLYMYSQGIKINFLMKKEWFCGPLNPLFTRLGGIPVIRSRHSSLTDLLAEEARLHDAFRLCITPEGTRSINPDWKHGFYYIALKANIPILLYGIDYEKKLIQCTKSFIPTGDIDREMKDVKLYFKDFRGRHPEKFTIGEV